MKDLISKIKNSKIWDAILRHSTLIIVGVACFILLGAAVAEIKTILIVCIFTVLACLLTGLVTYGLSCFKVSKKIFEGDDGALDFEERKLAIGFVSSCFRTVALLIGLITVAVYIAQSPKGW